jgi:prepilin-type N-terminal cleavage/methylation domain-containing protein
MNNINREKGFTIVELIVTLVIFGILVAAMVTRFVDLSSAAEAAACKSNQVTLEQAQRVYFIETSLQGNGGQYAGALEDLVPYINGATIPDCPGGGQYHILAQGRITCTIGDHQR